VRARTERHIADLRDRLRRIDEFEQAAAAELAGAADFRAGDPRTRQGRVDSPPGGRP
jgi:hypothetical protein